MKKTCTFPKLFYIGMICYGAAHLLRHLWTENTMLMNTSEFLMGFASGLYLVAIVLHFLRKGKDTSCI